MGQIGKKMVLMSATDLGPSFPTEQMVESGVDIKSICIMGRMTALVVPAKQRFFLFSNQLY